MDNRKPENLIKNIQNNKGRIKTLQYDNTKELLDNEYNNWKCIYDKPIRKWLFYTFPNKTKAKFLKCKTYISNKLFSLRLKINEYNLRTLNPSLFKFDINELEDAYFADKNNDYKRLKDGTLVWDSDNLGQETPEKKRYNELSKDFKNKHSFIQSMTDNELQNFQYKDNWIDGKQVAVKSVDTADKATETNNA